MLGGLWRLKKAEVDILRCHATWHKLMVDLPNYCDFIYIYNIVCDRTQDSELTTGGECEIKSKIFWDVRNAF